MRAAEFLTESYKEIEFVCVNPNFPNATDPELQKRMYQGLKQIGGVIPLWQEWGDYSAGQASLSAIYKDRSARAKILKLARQLGIQIDLEQPVSDDYVDRAMQGEHEGQLSEDNSANLSFKTTKGKNKFSITLSTNNKPAGVYQYDATTGRSIAEVYPQFRNKGLGKILVLNAIYTAAQLGMDFIEDESRTAAFDNVIDSLSNDGYIVNDDGYLYVTNIGEKFLQQKLLINESLRVDVPNDTWLQSKIEYAQDRGRNRFGAPYMGSTTAWSTEPVVLPVSLLKTIPGLRGEQQNVRKDDLEAIMRIMRDTGRLPLTDSGEEYAPFIQVAYNGEPWVNEGNHRIMAAAALGFESLPVELKYYDGGERIKSGPLYPGRIGLA